MGLAYEPLALNEVIPRAQTIQIGDTYKQPVTLQGATGDEIAFDYTVTANKATSGNATGIRLNFIETAVPGTVKFVDFQKGGVSKCGIDSDGNVIAAGSLNCGALSSTTGTFSGNVTVSTGDLVIGTSGKGMVGGSATGLVKFSGGSTVDLGANTVKYAETHATLANDMDFRAGSTSWMYYDDSAGLVDFQANDIGTTGKLGIGVAPSTMILITTEQETTTQFLRATKYYNSASQPNLQMRKARGTQASPSATLLNDGLGQISFTGYGASGWAGVLAKIRVRAAENFTATNQGTYMTWAVAAIGATSATDRIKLYSDGGFTVGAPAGDSKGPGTINAQAVYDDNVLLTDYVFDLALDGKVRAEDKVAAADLLKQPEIIDLDTFTARWKKDRHLPSMPSREQWQRGALSVGGLAQRLWETVELQALHIAQLSQRLTLLETA